MRLKWFTLFPLQISSSSTPAKMRVTSTPWREVTTTVNTPKDDARSSKKYTPNTLTEFSTTTKIPKDYTKSSYKDTPTTWKELPTTMKTPKDSAKSSNKDATTTFENLTTVVKTPQVTTKNDYYDTTATSMNYNTTMTPKTGGNHIVLYLFTGLIVLVLLAVIVCCEYIGLELTFFMQNSSSRFYYIILQFPSYMLRMPQIFFYMHILCLLRIWCLNRTLSYTVTIV